MDLNLAFTLSTYPLVFTGLIAALGLLVGSFLNVVILRFPVMMEEEWKSQCRELLECDCVKEEEEKHEDKPFNLAFPNSHCPKCKAELKSWDNIPVLSFLILRGKCRHCSEKISPRYPVIEAATAILSAYTAFHFGFGWQCGAALILVWALVSLSVIDFDHQLLPDDITLPLLWLGLLLNLFGVFTDLNSAVIGAMVGYLSLWSVYWLFKLVTGKEGMGYGDFKLLAVFGAWFGWKMIPLIVILSSFVGAFVGIGLILIMGRDKNIPIPFGPYLAAAGLIAMLWGEPMISYYLRLAL
ncbi:MAG: prepilin peptidase [Pseudomonadales bacterium]|nr:prepilin peptidase [Pseudomonadales bacterium]